MKEKKSWWSGSEPETLKRGMSEVNWKAYIASLSCKLHLVICQCFWRHALTEIVDLLAGHKRCQKKMIKTEKYPSLQNQADIQRRLKFCIEKGHPSNIHGLSNQIDIVNKQHKKTKRSNCLYAPNSPFNCHYNSVPTQMQSPLVVTMSSTTRDSVH